MSKSRVLAEEDIQMMPKVLQKLAALAIIRGMVEDINAKDEDARTQTKATTAMFIEPILYSVQQQREIDELKARVAALEEMYTKTMEQIK